MNLDYVMDQAKQETLKRLSIGSLFGGTFIAPEEKQNRGDLVLGSYEYCPEAREEEERVNQNDALHYFTPVGELEDRSDEFETDFVEDGFDEEGYPDVALVSVDLFAGPRANPLPKGMSLEQAVEKLLRISPVYAVGIYEMAGQKGAFAVLNMLPRIFSKLVAEGVYTPQVFQQTSAGAFSAYRIFKGHAADEKRVIGSEGGIACRIIEILNGWAEGTA